MSGSVNKVILLGNLGDEVKMHFFDDKNSIGRFPIATNESYTNRETGERVTQTEWHNIVVRNKLAELCEKYLNKGDKVFVEGKLKTRKWQDQQGNNKYTTEIYADSVQFLNNPSDSSQNRMSSNENQSSSNTPATPVQASEPEDDLPF